MFTFELICMVLEVFLKMLTLSGFFGFLKILKFLDFQRTLSLRRQFFSAGSACVDIFLAQANCQRRLSLRKFFPCFVRFFQRRLSLRTHFFSADSACVDIFLAQAQPAQASFQRTLSMPKNTKWRISAVVFEKKKKIPVLKSPTHMGFIGVKKMG